ncbi:hypothetical protein [Thiobacillus sedimenti]|uniref:Uncharacterized protein n=1 Tax=Thiobacillus sedimenti TaxID=3110231 RepID=A0ABZ1CM35_9PROT|nr:hypothetical protein [Thiobacillus sp. SCUT-2]WRS40453.1 hypothetical protein VA613_06145 [Thiobacillus sp. SCUT-2]
MANEPQAVALREGATNDLEDAELPLLEKQSAGMRYQLREEKDQHGRSRTVVIERHEREVAVVGRWFFRRLDETVGWQVAQEAISRLPVEEHE